MSVVSIILHPVWNFWLFEQVNCEKVFNLLFFGGLFLQRPFHQILLRQQPGPSKVERPDPQAEMDAEVLREDFDDIDMSNLGALLRGDTD